MACEATIVADDMIETERMLHSFSECEYNNMERYITS